MRRIFVSIPVVVVASLGFTILASAQRASPSADQPRRPQQPAATGGGAADLAAQIAELRSAVSRLEASIAANQPQGSSAMPAGGGAQAPGGMKGTMGRQSATGTGMGGMGRGMGMGGGMGKGAAGAMKGGMMDDMDQMPSGSGAAGGMAGMGGMEGMDAAEMSMEMSMMGMAPMNQGGSTAGSLRASSLPGFPGASHVYHIGATGFFLDHPDHIALDTAQRQELNRLKQTALLAKASTQRKVNEAEQQLWELTGADEPDAGQVQAKVAEIANLRAQQRMDFIRAVGEAAKVLTDEQRQVLLGLMEPAPQSQTPQHQGHSPPGK